MAKILFFEKPGCINNGKQQKVLRDGGHDVECIDILSHPWTRQELEKFVQDREPAEFMNHTAPAVKSGEIVPTELSREDAITMMLASPILIKRPLIVVENMYIQGFTDDSLKPYLASWDKSEDIITCPNLLSTPCDTENL